MPRQASTVIAMFMLLASVTANASQQIWQDMTLEQANSRGVDSGTRYFKADIVALHNLLGQVPHRSSGDFSHQIQLPMPDGSLARFQIIESPIMEDGLAQHYPEVKTFKVFGIDDEHASGRVDVTARGFSGMLQTSNGRVFIDPDHSSSQANFYSSKYRTSGQPGQPFSCGVHQLKRDREFSQNVESRAAQRIPGRLLEYRLSSPIGTTGIVTNGTDPGETTASCAKHVSDIIIADTNHIVNPVGILFKHRCWFKIREKHVGPVIDQLLIICHQHQTYSQIPLVNLADAINCGDNSILRLVFR